MFMKFLNLVELGQLQELIGELDQNAPRLLLVTLFVSFAIDLAPYLPKESKYVNHNSKCLIWARLN